MHNPESDRSVSEEDLALTAQTLKDSLEKRGAGQPHYFRPQPHFSRSMEIQRPGISYAGMVSNETNALIDGITGSLEQALDLDEKTD